MNFFEQELRKITDWSASLGDPRYIGRACYGRVSDNIRAKLAFVTTGTADHYTAFKITLVNNTEGPIDSALVRLRDLWGKKPVDNPNFPDGIHPHIWMNGGKFEWYCYKPDNTDYGVLAEKLDEYLEMFGEDIGQSHGQTLA